MISVQYFYILMLIGLFSTNETFSNRHNGRSDDDHDHDHKLPEPNWFIDDIYLNYSHTNDSNYLIYVEEINDIYTKLNIINHYHDDNDHDHDHDHDEHSDHDHSPRKCVTSYDLLKLFEINNQTRISKPKFEALCPALLRMAFDTSCNDHDHDHDHDESCISARDKYLYGSMSILVISFTSLASILIVGIFKKSKHTIILSLRALAMGTLLSDALIHLIPSALGLHTHSGDEHDEHHHHHDDNELDEKEVIWKTTVILSTIIVLWLLDSFLLNHDHDHSSNESHGHSHSIQELENHDETKHSVDNNEKSHVVTNHSFVLDEKEDDSKMKTNSETNKNEKFVEVKLKKPLSLFAYVKNFSSLTWLAFIADALHNCTDGLAIGAAYSQSVSLGLSTSLAILFHEIPHEIGEYGVFISSGLSHIGAVMMNLISATICLIAFFIVASVAKNDSTREWIFAAATGIFLYMSLVNLMPSIKVELKSYRKKNKSINKSILTIVSFAFGCTFMILLAVYEDALRIDVKSSC